MDVVEVPDGSDVVVGDVVLTALDWVVDSANKRLIGNPAHGGEEMIDCFCGRNVSETRAER
jgi:hypothetical protein